MSETTTAIPADQLPIIPETSIIEPIVQCGVLYLGTAPPGAGLRGLDAIQEPFSHRYPVDGTNTVRGIDAVLSVYDNGVQLAFARQPHAVIFLPITSLSYCASLRFSIVENDPTNQTSVIDWRFMPLDKLTTNNNKHPPLFCAITQRTQILPGDECHCFITKSIDAALALVRTISEVYANLKLGSKCLKAPIFYQLDRFGRKLSETTGVIYLSPANDDESQLNRNRPNRLKNESITRHYLFDPEFDGFFYRTDASLVEQWQLWDDDDFIGSRPFPPASPFGLHEGLYHDDTTHEIQRYLRRMDAEEHPSSCSCSSTSSSSSSSLSSKKSSRRYSRNRYDKQKSVSDIDQFDASFSPLKTSSFEPVLTQDNIDIGKRRQRPIIIEKVVPKPISSIPILNPTLPQRRSKYILEQPQQSFDPSNSRHKPKSNYISPPDFSYQINEYGEKITKDGNRIVFMDVIQPDITKNKIDPQSYGTPQVRPRSYQKRPKSVPVFDLKSIEQLFNEKQRHKSRNHDEKSKDNSNEANHLSTSDMLEFIDEYFEDQNGRRTKLNNHKAPQTMLNHLQSVEKKRPRQKISYTSSRNETRHRRSHSTLTGGPAMNYGERPSIPPVNQNENIIPPPFKQKYPPPPILTNEKLSEYVSNIYGTARSVKSSSSSVKSSQIKHQETNSLNTGTHNHMNNTTVVNPEYISAFRYMQSSINPNLLREYRGTYS